MSALWSDEAERARRGRLALDRARGLFGEDRFYSALMGVYESGG
jgi:hypothetical protein